MDGFREVALTPLFSGGTFVVAALCMGGTLYWGSRWWKREIRGIPWLPCLLALLCLIAMMTNPIGNLMLVGGAGHRAYAEMVDRVRKRGGFVGCSQSTLLDELGNPNRRHVGYDRSIWIYEPGPRWCYWRMDVVSFVIEDDTVVDLDIDDF